MNKFFSNSTFVLNLIFIQHRSFSGNPAISFEPGTWRWVFAGNDLRQVWTHCDVTSRTLRLCGGLHAVMEHHPIH